MSKYTKFIKQWNELTNDNYHCEALELMAVTLRLYKDAEICQHITKLRDLCNGLDGNLSQFQSTVRKRIFEFAAREMGDEFKLIH